jgi:hypothetical protein
MLDAGIARILMPPRFGGYGLDFDTWFDVTREISKADSSHGWCASLIIHHAHCIAQFPEEAQEAVWADGPDVAIAASFLPGTTIVPRRRRLSCLRPIGVCQRSRAQHLGFRRRHDRR